MAIRKRFFTKDPNGHLIMIQGVDKEDVITDIFSIQDKTYTLIIRSSYGRVETQNREFKIIKNGEETSNTVNHPAIVGVFDNTTIVMTEREEIDDAIKWLYPGERFTGWEEVEKQEKFVEAIKKWKEYPYNDRYFDAHRHKLMDKLKKSGKRVSLAIIENLEALRIAKRTKEMAELKIDNHYV